MTIALDLGLTISLAAGMAGKQASVPQVPFDLKFQVYFIDSLLHRSQIKIVLITMFYVFIS
jgi:hypothetical protein